MVDWNSPEELAHDHGQSVVCFKYCIGLAVYPIRHSIILEYRTYNAQRVCVSVRPIGEVSLTRRS